MSNSVLYECRLCLKDSQFCYSLFDEHVTEIIESFTSVKIDEDDNLPSTCCSKCLEDVYIVNKIRSRIIESDRILHERLAQKENNEVIEITEQEQIVIKTESTIGDSTREDNLVAVESTTSTNFDSKDSDEDAKSSSKSKYYCSDCNLQFTFQKYYLQHMKKHDILSVCKICGRQVLTCNYRRHLEVHKSSPKICELCGAVAKNAESLRGHMFYMHKSTAEQYKCKQCGKCYRYKYKYQLHVRKAHGGDRTHICEFCAKAFYTARDVNKHIQMTHMKLRPYICQYCNKGFSSSYARRTHIRQHTNEKPFKCEICAEGFRQRVSLKTHLKSKHGFVQKMETNISQQLDMKIENAV